MALKHNMHVTWGMACYPNNPAEKNMALLRPEQLVYSPTSSQTN